MSSKLRNSSEDTDVDDTIWQDPKQRVKVEAEPPAPAPVPATPEAGMQLGRYVVLSRLGSGTSGDVFAAYDPELDRRIAIKLIKRRRAATQRAQIRLRREAQALAKLEHPNIVTVYDVGLHARRLFIAMEYVDGRTLAQWQLEPGAPARPWREVLAVYEAAARGLAVSHELGLVHRDFKPENVMLGFDGRVRVMDFGLVAFRGEDSSNTSPASEPDDPSDSHARLTRSGALLGTPAYMAPEQFEGGEVTARSDQFAWCVALHEALYGARPFRGSTIDELRKAVTRGELLPPSRAASKRMPGWIHPILARGLAREPSQRYASMGELLAALGEGETRRRWWGRAAAGLGVCAVLGGIYGAQQVQRARELASCELRAGEIDEVWNPTARAAMATGLRRAGEGEVEGLMERLTPWIERQVEDWRSYAYTACVATRIDARWKDARYDAASWCLQDRRFELEALIEGVSRASSSFVPDAIMAAAELPPVSLCTAELSELSVEALPDPAVRPALAEARRELSVVRYQLTAGQYDLALDRARALAEEAESLGWAPLRLAIRAQEAIALERTDAFAEAEALARETYVEAASAGIWDVAFTTSAELIDIVGFDLARHEEGFLWATQAQVAVARGGDPLGLREAARASSLGTLYSSAGEHERAREQYARALELRRASLGSEHPGVGDIYFVLATVTDDSAQAVDYSRRALAIYERSLGSTHPYVAAVLHELGLHSEQAQDFTAARAALSRALELQIQSMGADHLEVAKTRSSLARIDSSLGEHERAREGFEGSVPVIKGILGNEHPLVASKTLEAADVYEALGELERAQQLRQRALSIYEGAHPQDHPDVLGTLAELARAEQRRGEFEAALAYAERGAAQARQLDPLARSRQELVLAELLWALPAERGRDRARARQLVAAGVESLGGTGREGAARLAELERWLDEHPELPSLDVSRP